MKVFLSWSGEASGQIARELAEWIPMILQSVRIFLSPIDIEKGSRWGADISRELGEANYGLACLTRDNLNAPWLVFEAGALSKLQSGRVATLLFGVSPTEVKQPLSMFQATKFEEGEFLQLLSDINKAAGGTLSDEKLRQLFTYTWEERREKIQLVIDGLAARAGAVPAPTPTVTETMLSELLSLTRRHGEMLSSHQQALVQIVSDLRDSANGSWMRSMVLGGLSPKRPTALGATTDSIAQTLPKLRQSVTGGGVEPVLTGRSEEQASTNQEGSDPKPELR